VNLSKVQDYRHDNPSYRDAGIFAFH